MSAKVAITIVAQCARKTACFSIVDGAGKVYVPVAADHKNQNTKLMPFVGKKVKVSGTLLEKGELAGRVIKTIEAAQ